MEEKKFFYPELTDLTVVVRAAGERTERVCVDMLREQLPDPSQLSVLHEKPFSSAVIRCFEIGIDSGSAWLIAVDADIIPLPDSLDRAREICGKMADSAFCATPLFLCKTVGGFVMRGLHCYRASLLDEALGLTEDLPEDLRPESRYHDAMRRRGYTREVYAKGLGIHEYEQSFRHIYLKSMLRARKDSCAGRIEARLSILADQDPDALVALWGFQDSADHGANPAEYDWDAPLPRFEERLGTAGMSEKPALDSDQTRGLAMREILGHPYRKDTNTDAWIQRILGFDRDPPELFTQLKHPPRFTRSARKAGT